MWNAAAAVDEVRSAGLIEGSRDRGMGRGREADWRRVVDRREVSGLAIFAF